MASAPRFIFTRRPPLVAGALLALAIVAVGPAPVHGSASGGHGAEAAPASADHVSAESASGLRAVKLDEFKIRTSHTVSSRKDCVSFTLHIAVKSDDYPSFDELFRRRKIKVRDQVVVATRLVPIEDYDDPALTKFRRRILLRLRRTMPELPIAEVYISDFSSSVETL